MKKKLTFPKKLRLLKIRHFNIVFKNPTKIYVSEISIFSKYNELKYPRIGINISKKYVKNAHDRNRIKRIIRESFRKVQYDLPKMDLIIITKKGIKDLDNQTLKKK